MQIGATAWPGAVTALPDKLRAKVREARRAGSDPEPDRDGASASRSVPVPATGGHATGNKIDSTA